MKTSLRIIYSLIVFILGIVLLSVLTVLLIYENRQTSLSFDQVTHTNIVRHALEKVFSNLKDAESAQRGFIITRDSAFLEAFKAIPSLEKSFDDLDSMLENDQVQRANLKQLKNLFYKRKVKLELIVNRSKNHQYHNSPEFLADVQSDHLTMSNVHQLVNQMQSLEEIKLANNQEDARKHSMLPAIIGIGISIFSIIIFILAFYFTNIELKTSNRLNDELERKNLQLEKYTKELSSFTNLTSHDMQEPLRKIEIFISMIEDREKESLSPKALQHFEKIKDSVGRMRHLFFNIMTFSLADQVQNVKEKVDLNIVLSETLDSLRVYIKDTNAVISNDPLPYVQGVKHQLVQLFQNLISNSLKYKKHDSIPEIQITTELIEGRNTVLRELQKDISYYKINFRDNGIGFDQKYVDKIFEIFQRHVRTDKHGIGIGLSICRKIAQNHSGTITAESQINQGALFSLYIPAVAQNGTN
jgi:signal transduction histidine kinase